MYLFSANGASSLEALGIALGHGIDHQIALKALLKALE